MERNLGGQGLGLVMIALHQGLGFLPQKVRLVIFSENFVYQVIPI